MPMRCAQWASLIALVLVDACTTQAPVAISIVDGAQLRTLVTNERVPSAILARAAILLGPSDELLLNGHGIRPDTALPNSAGGTFQIRRAVALSVLGRSIQTAARTVGEALSGAGVPLYVADRFSPIAGAVITGPVAVEYLPSQDLTVKVDGENIRIRSSAGTVGGALAEAGLPLLGLDFSRPDENAPLPSDGHIQIVRVSESIVLTQRSIPFEREFTDSPDVEVGQEQVLQPGLNGLAVSRVRVRYEDGREVSQQTEAETVVRPPQNRIAARGTKIVLKSTTINGVNIRYWRVLQMYATVYSGCSPAGCGTASGLRGGKGVVAVDPALYAYLSGQRVFVPGYGTAVIGDVGGGYILEQNTRVSRYRWIDLGFDGTDLPDMTGWVTVYFLAPAPASIPDVLR